MQATAITTCDGLAALRPEWDALAAAAPGAGPFLSGPWAQAWLRRADSGTPCVVVLRSDTGDLRALIPLVSRAGRLQFIAADRSMYLGILARPDDLTQAAGAFATWLRDSRAWRQALLSSLPEEQLRPLEEALEVAGIAHRLECDKPSYVMALPESAAAFAARLTQSFRKRLDYYRRRLERECDVQYRICRPREDPAALDEFLRLHLLRMRAKGQRSRFEESAYADFVREALSEMDGAASVGLLQCGGRAAAALAGIRWGDTFCSWNSGFDPAFAHYNVGDVTHRFTIESAIAAGARRFDFLWGGEDYKLRWGAQRRDTYRLDIERSRLRLALRAAAHGAARAARRAGAAAKQRSRPAARLSSSKGGR
jgi:CelD/BcsL family acetyltransferase involved in cellulose biosynthesis